MLVQPHHRRKLRKNTPLHVLVVDDDNATASAFQKLVQSSGYETRAACSYREALAMASQWVPDLVISDITMPGKDGLELMKTLLRAYPSLKAIAISGTVTAEAVDAAREAGYLEFLPKPLDLDRLLAAMDRALDRPGAHHS